MREYRIGRLNGRFVVTWTDGGKRRRYRLDACTVKDAQREAIDVIRGQTVTRETATVSMIWQAYRGSLGERPTAATMGYTGKSVLLHFGALRPDQITDDHCQTYIAARLAAGRKKGAIWTEMGHLASCLTWAQKKRVIDRAPHILRPQKPAPKERYLSRAEIDRIMTADCQPHIRLAILLMLATAGRVGAILDLTWDRVDLDRNQINLRADLEGPRKGRAIVPINATLRAALTVAAEAALTDHVVEWNGGRVGCIRKGFQTAATNAGLARISPHVLRHTAGVHMAEGGVPMSVIAQYLGHSNTSITERVYGRYSPEFLSGAAEILDFGKLRKVQ